MGMDQPPSQPPSGGAKPPDWGEMSGKIKAAQGPDRLILIAGLLFFIDSFLPWFRIKLGILGISGTVSGWNYGGLAVFAILLAIAATAVALAGVVGMQMGAPKQTAQLLLGLAGACLVFTVIRWLTHPGFAAYGLYIAIVLSAIMTYGAWQKFQSSPA